MLKSFTRFVSALSFVAFAVLGGAMLPGTAGAQTSGGRGTEHSLLFREGDIHRVAITEVLRLMMHFPQVDTDAARPSVRTSDYSFTERVEKVYPDGSALVAASLDSFKTLITIGEGKGAEEFFRFNSSNDYDLQHNLRDIKTLPRAQFLGQTLRFVMLPDGTVHSFENLQAFHDAAVGKGYDYDMVHAMLSLSDSLRIGQLLELGAGGLAGLRPNGDLPFTATEIPIRRSISARATKGGTVHFTEKYSNPPAKIDYLEGIATPLEIKHFYGAGAGEIVMKDRFLAHSVYRDTANVLLGVDIDDVPEEITRVVTTDVSPVDVMRGGTVSIKEIEMHHETPKDPVQEAEKNAIVIDPSSGKVENPPQTGR